MILRHRISLLIVSPLALVLLVAGCTGQTGAPGPAGIGFTGATVDTAGHLILLASDNNSFDAGYVLGPSGLPGVTGAAGPAGPQGPAGTPLLSLSSIFEQVKATLVRIEISGNRVSGSATGIIVSSRGYILTAYHAIDGADSINVTLPEGQNLPATLVGGSRERDDALLKLSSVPDGLKAAVLGSSAALAVGDFVAAAGFSMGYDHLTFVSGIVSAFPTMSDGYKYIQTDAAINVGDSGGPLLNMKGEVVGVNESKETYDSGGTPVLSMVYCIPIDEVRSLVAPFTGG